MDASIAYEIALIMLKYGNVAVYATKRPPWTCFRLGRTAFSTPMIIVMWNVIVALEQFNHTAIETPITTENHILNPCVRQRIAAKNFRHKLMAPSIMSSGEG